MHNARLQRAKFKGKLAGTAPDFGYITKRESFFIFLTTVGFVDYGGFIESPIATKHRKFHVFMVLKDFNYSASNILNHSEITENRVGYNGSILLDENYRAIGFAKQINTYR